MIARPTRSGTMVLAVLAAALLAVPAAEPQSDRFDEATDVVLVQIPVYVTLDDEPVRNLTAANFEIVDGRKKQKVVALDIFDLALSQTEEKTGVETPIPPAGRRYFVMLFDLSNSFPAGIVRAREAAMELAKEGLHPSDLVAVATYSKREGIEILLSFSTDRLQLEAALDNLGLVNPFDQLNDPLRLQLATYQELWQGSGGGTPVGGPGGAGSVRADALRIMIESLKDLSVMSARSTRDQAKQQITDLAANLDDLAGLLSSVSGRKQIVLFSQGFDSEVVFGTQDVQRIQEIVAESQYGKTWRVDSEERFGASDAQGSLLQMLEHFNRSDCAIHTVDVGGLVAGGDAASNRVGGLEFGATALDRGHDGLFLMANETGGEFYRNFNDLSDAMDDLLTRTSLTYVLSFSPRDTTMDGSYHPIKVRLKGVPKGARVSHRPGYFARRPYSEMNPIERQLQGGEKLVAGVPGGRITTQLLVAAFPSADPTPYVLTAIEIDGTTLMADQSDNVVPAEIYTYAFDDEGQIRDFSSQAVMIDLYKVGYRMNSGFKLLSHLELPPGEYEIRSLVRNARTGASGLAVAQVVVPDFLSDEPALLPPLFIEAEDQWLIGYEEREDGGVEDYPLMARGKPLVPASRPHLVSGQRIPLLLIGHELPQPLEADGQLIGPGGQVVDNVEITVDNRLPDKGEGERLMASLFASAIDPGDYDLLITVRGQGEEASNSLPVRFSSVN